jgi:TPP-dependent indolepyruvate ferredoxin oxidoreductase alpha subunit
MKRAALWRLDILGTPSTEILENLVKYKSDVYCDWSPNDKVAFEVAAGAALTGARCMLSMEHVGLNVAAETLMTMAYVGTVGGFIACVETIPGMHIVARTSRTHEIMRGSERFPSSSRRIHRKRRTLSDLALRFRKNSAHR